MNRIISGEKVGSKTLAVLLFGIFLVLLTAPFLFELIGISYSERAMKAMVQIMVFMILAASYDLLIGYTAIISLCHSVFFAIGAYSLAIIMRDADSGWSNVIIAIILSTSLSALLAFILALIGIRIKNIYFTLVTFALAFGALSFVVKLSEITGGLDGLIFEKGMPEFFLNKVQVFDGAEYRIQAYYFIFFVSLALFLFMLRIVSSPFGKTLQAIRENEFRCAAIGYKVNSYKILVVIIAAVIASLAGILYASWIKIAVPNTFLNIEIMLMILIVVIVGGKGSIYGSVIGAVVIVLLENYLSSYLDILFQSDFPEKIQMVLTDPFYLLEEYKEVVPIRFFFTKNRWALYIGLFYIFSVYCFRAGIAGKLRDIKRVDFKNIDNLKGIIKSHAIKLAHNGFSFMRLVIFLSALGQMFTGLWNLDQAGGKFLLISAALTYFIGSSSLVMTIWGKSNES